MPKNTLIRVVTQKQGKQPRPQWFTLASLTGEFVNRLFKVHHKLDVEEVCIDEQGKQSTIYNVLSEDELSLLIDHWPHLELPDNLPPEPEPLKVKEEKVELVEDKVEIEDDNDYSDWKVEQLKELLDNNDVKYDKRKKKRDYFIELVKTNNL